MEITKELKEKLLQPGSLEEVKALLGEQATEEETFMARMSAANATNGGRHM